jgi:hypothetical protein
MDVDGVTLCRWIITGGGLSTLGGRPALTTQTSITGDQWTDVRATLQAAAVQQPECMMVDSKPSPTYTLLINDSHSHVWRIELSATACLGYRLGGKRYLAQELPQLLAAITKSEELMTVSGTVVAVGGPPGVGKDPLRATVQFASESGHVVTSYASGYRGFVTQLPPGTYTVTATSDAFHSVDGGCQASAPLELSDQKHPVEVRVRCFRR